MKERHAICPHGFQKPSNCFECMEDGNLEPLLPAPRPAAVGFPMVARYPGHCDGCNLAIHEGQSIRRMTDDTYQHSDCVGEWA